MHRDICMLCYWDIGSARKESATATLLPTICRRLRERGAKDGPCCRAYQTSKDGVFGGKHCQADGGERDLLAGLNLDKCRRRCGGLSMQEEWSETVSLALSSVGRRHRR